jgi:acetyl-CoA carboxylase carboxyltransferase component
MSQPDDEHEIRPELAELRARLAATSDEARPEAVARRRKTGQRTARENIADLVDAGSFVEYGALALAAQKQRLGPEQLIAASPADGFIGGLGSINGALFDAERARAMVMAYDHTVFAGTQGAVGHKKLDRLLALAHRWRLPIVLFAEGGGGRPNDTDGLWVAGLDTPGFLGFAALSGVAPRVGIVSGRCFAGNAALLGTCDVIIATENANIGMGGPAMIEGGGLGRFAPEEVGPIDVQSKNGVVDVRVPDEAAAVAAAKRYLSYFQGPISHFECDDQNRLRDIIPERRRRAYKIAPVVAALADRGSVLELRREFGIGIFTALVRIEGQPFGLLANNPFHLGGAIDSDAADKAARFLQLCDAFELPLISLVDTPGFMVGPKAETTALVRHVSRMFVAAGSLSVPLFAVVLRKGYGLGAQAMTGGHFHAPVFTAAWPTGEFGGMGIEGAVRLGMRKELEAIADAEAREQLFQKVVAQTYERGKAINMASVLEVDAVIDPSATRAWIMRGWKSIPKRKKTKAKKRFIDTW